jgi:hypothetical protein
MTIEMELRSTFNCHKVYDPSQFNSNGNKCVSSNNSLRHQIRCPDLSFGPNDAVHSLPMAGARDLSRVPIGRIPRGSMLRATQRCLRTTTKTINKRLTCGRPDAEKANRKSDVMTHARKVLTAGPKPKSLSRRKAPLAII